MAIDDSRFTPEDAIAGQEPAGSAARRQPRDAGGSQDQGYLDALAAIRRADVPQVLAKITVAQPSKISGDKISVTEPRGIGDRLEINRTSLPFSGIPLPEITTTIIPAQVTNESPIAMEPKHPVGAVRIVPVFDRITAVPGSIRILPPGVDVNGLGKQTIRLGDILNDPPGHGQRGEILPPRGSRKGPTA